MLIKISELRERPEPLLIEADFTDQDLKVRDQISSLEGPVPAKLKISLHSADRVRVVGSLNADVVFTCSRCLKNFPRNIRKSFDLEYWPDPVVTNEGEEFELTYPELTIGFYRNDELDLSAVISEQIVLEFPMKSVCREDCRGLCDQCGKDLNEGPCECEPVSVDPRLAPLADLKKKIVH
ncbi:MAG: DUF177 domain-containing protein [Acidobacteria bacterium]|nr:DUF177 domain-containing protein [Acidobacteriota bacterium]